MPIINSVFKPRPSKKRPGGPDHKSSTTKRRGRRPSDTVNDNHDIIEFDVNSHTVGPNFFEGTHFMPPPNNNNDLSEEESDPNDSYSSSDEEMPEA